MLGDLTMQMISLSLLALLPLATCFSLPQVHGLRSVGAGVCVRCVLRMASPEEDEERKDIAAMRIKAIKAELEALMVPHADAFEKDDLVQRLIDARRQKKPDNAPEQESAPSMGQSMGMCVVHAAFCAPCSVCLAKSPTETPRPIHARAGSRFCCAIRKGPRCSHSWRGNRS